ncbi:hypothetical protein NE683_06895 [Bariatricus massiliensis]|uniref:Uncharacterized protein n=1 Tax=Bariatricus massiliensis TaxID=1745713 RepID=A0ABS8DBX0_9FIRM|nr:hypothetical protein [Bariatricus massiliensis]MCB7303826.1 hypothetical protein [Bariatricus massiliensis]MCB7373242.1 hypothetical protein [Bariatricus massiliensis]MCB7385912.1 hypothetical protein [Bariatricus massiliensis]MCB7410074.1 hypothetical protein [Bariatricus massiliensis]MCQ5252958.1 hypothetical protein [Bariatricus massiliensis]
MKIKERAVKLKLQIPAVFLALKDRRTPWYAKVLAGITVAYAFSPEQSMERAQNLWSGGKPKKWYFAIPIVLIWGIIILLIIKLFA